MYELNGWGGAWGAPEMDCSKWHQDTTLRYYQNPRSLTDKVASLRFGVYGNRKTGYERGVPASKGDAMAVLEQARRQATLDSSQGAVNFFNDSQQVLFSELSDTNIIRILERSLTIYARGNPACRIEPSVLAAAYLNGVLEASGGTGIPQLQVGVFGQQVPAMEAHPGAAEHVASEEEGMELSRAEAEKKRAQEKRRKWWEKNKMWVLLGASAFILLTVSGGIAVKRRRAQRAIA